MVGKTLGHYEILGPLGAGGMGEVYRAWDTKLDRDVAIKVLPEDFATDPDRLARFEREAKLLASLNHGNIAAIYGLEDEVDQRFIVMEVVEGETLAERIARSGRIEVDDALDIARQIAEALEAAHDNGVIHRDLKPANIKVKEDGTVKVLDFGLAKAIAPDPTSAAAEELANSPTLTARATQMGVVLGTAAYMAPEQAKGKAVDKRADVWAFGVVLFEMLAGTRPFDGSDVSEVMARVIDREPDWSSLPASTPRAIERLLRRCLVKQRNDRLHDIGDARLEIDDAATEPAEVSSDGSGATRPTSWRRALPVAAAVVVTGLLAGLAAWILRPTPPTPEVIRFEHILPDGHRIRGAQTLALSRDGRQFVYSTEAGLFRRTMDNREARLIPGTGAVLGNPAFSPNGQSVGYFQDGQLKRIPVAGGAPVDIGPATAPLGVSWETDGTILFGQPEGILRVSENGGDSEVVIPSPDGELVYGPQLLPDGDAVLFTVSPAPGFGRWREARIAVQSIRTGKRTDLDITGSNARYVSTGHLVYVQEDALHAVAFDVDRLAVVGGAASTVQDVARSVLNTTGAAQYAVSDNGTLVYLTGATDPTTRTLVWVDREGGETPVGAPPRAYEHPRLSPDGTRVMYSVDGPGEGRRWADIWTWDLARQLPTRITFNAAANRSAVWIDDARVAFLSNRDGSNRVYVKSADGVGDAEPLEGTEGEAGQLQFPTAVTPDRSRLIMEMAQAGSGRERDLAVVSLEGGGMIGEPLGTEFNEMNFAVSPDGSWIAFGSDRSGEYAIYVAPFPDVGGGVPVSLGGGGKSMWHPNGGELFYQTFPDSRLMSVPVVTSPSFDFQPAVELFDASPYNIGGGRQYDIARDGRFLMVKKGEERLAIVIVRNWFEELKQRVPTGGSQ